MAPHSPRHTLHRLRQWKAEMARLQQPNQPLLTSRLVALQAILDDLEDLVSLDREFNPTESAFEGILQLLDLQPEALIRASAIHALLHPIYQQTRQLAIRLNSLL